MQGQGSAGRDRRAPWQSVEPGSQARQGQSFALESTPPRAPSTLFFAINCLPSKPGLACRYLSEVHHQPFMSPISSFPFTKKGQGRTALGYLALLLHRVHLDPTPPCNKPARTPRSTDN